VVKFLALFQKEIISLGFALLTALILWMFRARVRLLWGLTHAFAFMLRPAPPTPEADGSQLPAPPPFLAHSRSLILVNWGRLPATNVEVVFNWRPDNLEVWPPRPFEEIFNPDHRFTVRFANLAPKEQFQIEVLTAHEMPNVANVRCSECVGTLIPIQPMRVWPKWMYVIFWCLCFLGLAAVVYVVLTVGALFLN
jgi:hypothetical protein